MKINDIKSEYLALQELLKVDEIDTETGEFIDNSELLKELTDKLDNDINDKLVNIEYIKKEYLDSVEAIKTEKKRLDARQKSYLKKIENLKSLQMYLMDGKKIETDLFNFGYRKSASVEVIDDTLVDSKYLKEKKTYTVDKALIKEDIKNGIDVVGAEIVENINLAVK